MGGVHHRSRDHQPRGGSGCQAANPLPLAAESPAPVGRQTGRSVCVLEHPPPPASQERERLGTAVQQVGSH